MKFLSISFALSMVGSAGKSTPFVSTDDLPSKMIGRPIEQYEPYRGETSPPLLGSTLNFKHASFDDETGDILFEFAPIQQGGNIRPDTNLILDTEIAITCNNETTDHSNIIARRRSRANGQTDGNGIYPAVAMTAMVPARKPLLVVNGGWIRRAVELQNISCRDDWDISILAGATITHPGNGYKRVGRPLYKSISTGIMKLNGGKNRQNEFHSNKLKEKPRKDELKINQEMKSGRKPKRRNSNRRNQSSRTAKILVHGYCANKNPFPTEHFTNGRSARIIEFSDPDGYRIKNWKTDEFARKIARFTNQHGIEACNIIAHSQGGVAALHLHNYYWSCLDDGTIIGTDEGGSESRSRLIQSVGSPYQGTKLANVKYADIVGKIVGQGCGSNEDLTEKGARLWLRGISSFARSAVTYYTTSAGDESIRKDITGCSEETSFVLEGPNDGVVERRNGQLPGGNFGGHSKNQCHTEGLNGYLSQTRDVARNRVMDRVEVAVLSSMQSTSGAEL